ncbi:MAG: DUF5615 family PIN-like protein [Ilumatobacteraceae bacterium]
MKLLCDQNLSRRLVSRLASAFPETAHVAEIGLDQATDEEIWAHAGAEGFVVVSKDSDFRQLGFLHGPPPKVVWLQVGNVTTDVIHELLAGSVAVLGAFDHSDEEALLVLDSKQSNASE